MKRERLAVISLLMVAAVWGGTFVTVQDTVRTFPVLPFLAYRFLGSSILLAAPFFRDLRRMSPRALRLGVLSGLFLAGGYIGQTWGLEHLPVPTVGFITGLFVVFTPLLAWLVTGKPPGRLVWAGIGAAAVGLYFLTGGVANVGLADLVVLVSAVSFAAQILVMETGVSQVPYGGLVVVEMAVTGIVALGGALMTGPLPAPEHAPVWAGLVVTGLLAGALAYWVQAVVQQYISGTRTAIIMTTESLFAALAAFLFQGVVLPAAGMIGALFIVAGVVLIEVVPRLRRPGASTSCPSGHADPDRIAREGAGP